MGGFWDHLQYSREKEDLGLALIDQGWELAYAPDATIRHYSDSRGRSTIADRRYIELRNGILVLWRRLGIPLSLLAIAGRVCTMSAKSVMRREQQLGRGLTAVPEAMRDWQAHRLKPAAAHHLSRSTRAIHRLTFRTLRPLWDPLL